MKVGMLMEVKDDVDEDYDCTITRITQVGIYLHYYVVAAAAAASNIANNKIATSNIINVASDPSVFTLPKYQKFKPNFKVSSLVWW